MGMPKETLSDKGPGGGGWIYINKHLHVWGDGSCFAVGDCNFGCIGAPPNFELPPIPKISYPTKELNKTWWPWGAGMFATSLGPHDACFVLAANENKGSGCMVNWWIPAALQKEIIETTKVNECKNGIIGILI